MGHLLEVVALVDGEEVGVNIEAFCKSHPHPSELVRRHGYRWGSLTLTKVIGKSETPLSDDWVTSYDDAWGFLAKKRTLSRLKEDGVVELVEKWANIS